VTTSVSFRLRRVTTEEAYVYVPVTDDVMTFDGTASRLDVDKLAAAAVELGREAEWLPEALNVGLHPIQKPAPEDRPPWKEPQA
jgi:hypothetical protein